MNQNQKLAALGEPLIHAVNKIQDIFAQAALDFRLDLPQVAVVGSQSSGKSSVLEALVGRDFLPRGPDICTRRPLVLQLVKSPPDQPLEYGEFLHLPSRRFTNFDDIRSEIAHETDRLTGSNKGVSDQPIRLKIVSPHVLTMTLVDLPGTTRIPVGDQPTDIESRIKDMILTYIQPPSCLILAVSAANVDLATSDALQLAKLVDPHGERTIGVLTKVDIMDRGTDASHVLRNALVPLRLGYVAVVNRSQADIASRKPMLQCRMDEEAFFASKVEYSDVRDKTGTPHLARTLNILLVQHIQSAMPSLRSRIESVLTSRLKELASYGEPLHLVMHSAGGKAGVLLRLLHAYAESFTRMLDGRSESLPTTELAGGARIRHIFHEIFVKSLDHLDPCGSLSDEDVRTAIRNSGGVKGCLLIPDAPFEALVKSAIRRLLGPALQCNQFVYEELLKIASQSQLHELNRFPRLSRFLEETVLDFITAGSGPAERMIRDLLDCELSHINTMHPMFVGGSQAVALVVERRRGGGGGGGRHASSSTMQQQQGQKHHHHHNGPRPTTTTNATTTQATTMTTTAASSKAATTTTQQQQQQQQSTNPPPHPSQLLMAQEDEPLTVFDPTDLMSSVQEEGQEGSSGAGYFTSWLKRGMRGTPPTSNPSSTTTTNPSSTTTNPSHPSSTPATFSSSSTHPHHASHPHASPLVSLHEPPSHLLLPPPHDEQEAIEVEVTRLLVQSYFDIVRKNLQDFVPKAVMHFLVSHVQRGLHQHLIQSLYKEHLIDELIAEREDIVLLRKECSDAVMALRAALGTMDALPRELSRRMATGSMSLVLVKGGGGNGGVREEGKENVSLTSGGSTPENKRQAAAVPNRMMTNGASTAAAAATATVAASGMGGVPRVVTSATPGSIEPPSIHSRLARLGFNKYGSGA